MTRRKIQEKYREIQKGIQSSKSSNGVQNYPVEQAHLRQDSIEEAAMNHLNPLFLNPRLSILMLQIPTSQDKTLHSTISGKALKIQ